MVADTAVVRRPGPWEHRQVAANGARFHLATAGQSGDPLVVLLHGFPSFWWEWRGVIEPLAAAGYYVAAMDLRGFGASDKSHKQLTTPKYALDVAGVISSLGYSSATIVGRGLGAQVAWAMPSYAADVTAGIVAVGTPHPLALRRVLKSRVNPDLQVMHVPQLLERSLRSGDGVEEFLGTWSYQRELVLGEAGTYTEALNLPFAASCAVDAVRWQARSPFLSDMRLFLKTIDREIEVPVLAVRGAQDQMYEAADWVRSAKWAPQMEQVVIEGAGHFVPEEAPAELTAQIARVAAR